MVNINVVYDEEYDDVDIVALPENIYENLSVVVHEFMEWLPNSPKEDCDFWINVDGKVCLALETVGFVKWINRTYSDKKKQATIVKQHTDYCPEYARVDF